MEDVLSWLRRLRPGEDLDPDQDQDPVPDPAPDPAAVPDPVGAATKEADPNPDPAADPLHPRTERILEAVLGKFFFSFLGVVRLAGQPINNVNVVVLFLTTYLVQFIFWLYLANHFLKKASDAWLNLTSNGLFSPCGLQ